jgi:protocatechuate 3,4-dioxygenase beta subunit
MAFSLKNFNSIIFLLIFCFWQVAKADNNKQQNNAENINQNYVTLPTYGTQDLINTINIPVNPDSFLAQNQQINNNFNQSLFKINTEESLLNKIYNQKKSEALDPYIVIQVPKIETEFSKKLSPYEPKTPTPPRFFLADLSMPEIFGKTNNLAKKTGSFYRAFGEVIFIQGNISDSFGVPISNVALEIWQTNSAGKYHTLLEKNSEFFDKYFNMSGRTITDNLGNYHFITIMPGSISGRAPHINFNIYHPKFGKLETEMYFVNHPQNQTDYQYLAYSAKERELLTADVRTIDFINPEAIKLCTFNIVMKGIHQFKKF